MAMPDNIPKAKSKSESSNDDPENIPTSTSRDNEELPLFLEELLDEYTRLRVCLTSVVNSRRYRIKQESRLRLQSLIHDGHKSEIRHVKESGLKSYLE